MGDAARRLVTQCYLGGECRDLRDPGLAELLIGTASRGRSLVTQCYLSRE